MKRSGGDAFDAAPRDPHGGLLLPLLPSARLAEVRTVLRASPCRSSQLPDFVPGLGYVDDALLLPGSSGWPKDSLASRAPTKKVPASGATRRCPLDVMATRPIGEGLVHPEPDGGEQPELPGAALNVPSAATLLAARRGRPACPRPVGFVQHLHGRSTWAGLRRERSFQRSAMALAAHEISTAPPQREPSASLPTHWISSGQAP